MRNTLGIFGILLASLAALPSTALAVTYGQNLIVNGDAETDVGSTDGSVIGPVSGFTTQGNFTVTQYAAGGGFPEATDPGPVTRGLNFFSGGPESDSSSAFQLIDLSANAASIDTGEVSFDLSAFLGGFSGQSDNAVLTVSFLDASNLALGSASLGPVTEVDRDNITGLLQRETTGALPTGTRALGVTLAFSRINGSYNDGYADNLSLSIAAVPEPASLAMLSLGLVVLGGHSLRQARRNK